MPEYGSTYGKGEQEVGAPLLPITPMSQAPPFLGGKGDFFGKGAFIPPYAKGAHYAPMPVYKGYHAGIDPHFAGKGKGEALPFTGKGKAKGPFGGVVANVGEKRGREENSRYGDAADAKRRKVAEGEVSSTGSGEMMSSNQGDKALRAPIMIKGLPWTATEDQIQEFFTGLDVREEDIRMIVNPKGNPSGNAIVYFLSSQTGTALYYNGQVLGSRYLEISGISEEMALKQLESQPNTKTKTLDEGIIWVRGLPFTATPLQVAGLFEAFGVKEEGVVMAIHKHGPRQGSGNGEAYIRFTSPELAKTALNNMQKATLGNRYLELFPSNEKQLQNACYFEGHLAKLNNSAQMGGRNNAEAVHHTKDSQHYHKVTQEIRNMPEDKGWIKLRGLPYQCGPHDVVEFVNSHATTEITTENLKNMGKIISPRNLREGNVKIVEKDVYLKYGRFDCKPTGDAFILLPDANEAVTKQALLDKKRNQWPGVGEPTGKNGKGKGKTGFGQGGKGKGKGGKGRDMYNEANNRDTPKSRTSVVEEFSTEQQMSEGVKCSSQEVEEWNKQCAKMWETYLNGQAEGANTPRTTTPGSDSEGNSPQSEEQKKMYDEYLQYFYGY